jgi:hypothetical protein
MAAPRVHNFNSSFICFFRPRKRDYCLLTWNTNARQWSNAELVNTDTPLTLHRSNTQQAGTGYLTLRGLPGVEMNFTLDGSFLQSVNTLNQAVTVFPIQQFASYNRIPSSLKKTAYIANQDPATYLQAQDLYAVAPPPAPPAPNPPAPLPPSPQPTTVVVEALPRRIAWLIAAEAEKQEESCAITMDTISPLTAAVTTCFHCFDAEALASWNVTRGGGATECPLCKKKCLFTKAYEEAT